jgi:hypothetical protein
MEGLSEELLHRSLAVIRSQEVHSVDGRTSLRNFRTHHTLQAKRLHLYRLGLPLSISQAMSLFFSRRLAQGRHSTWESISGNVMVSLRVARILRFGECSFARRIPANLCSSRAASQQRVIDTSLHFLNGYLSQGNFLHNTTLNRGMIVTLPDSVNFTFANSLTPGNGCPLFETGDKSALAGTFRASYQRGVAKRLNKMLDGLQLNSTDVGPMMDLCGFQTVINGNQEFCSVFERMSKSSTSIA